MTQVLSNKGAAGVALPEDVREYELMAILPPDLTDAELKAKVQDIREAMSQHGGKVLDQEVTPLRDFAYRIKKYDQGYYATFHFSFPIAQINELDRYVRIEAGVVRHLLLICPKNYEFKGLMQYEEEAEALRLQEAEERKSKESEEQERRNRPARAARPEKPAVVPQAAANVTPKQSGGVSPDTSKPELNKVDEQLKAILDNPDIQI